MPPESATAPATANGHAPGHLGAVDPPPARAGGRRAPFTVAELDLAAELLRAGHYVSDRRAFQTRAQAAHRADALKRALARAPHDFDPARLRRRTWFLPSRKRFGWALHAPAPAKGKGRAR